MSERKKEGKWLFINQALLVRNVPFFLYVSVLAVLYIYNGHHAEKAIKDINKTSKELKNQQYEFKMVNLRHAFCLTLYRHKWLEHRVKRYQCHHLFSLSLRGFLTV